jgi:hypothetical protein
MLNSTELNSVCLPLVCLQAWTELALGDDGDADLSDDESAGEWGQLSGSSSSSGSSASSTYSSSGTSSSSSDDETQSEENSSSSKAARNAAAKRRGSMQRLGYESSTGTGWATANSSRSSSSSSGSDADSDSSSTEDEDDQESSIEQGVFGDPDLSFPPHLPSAKRALGGRAAAADGGVPAGHRSPAAKGAAAAAAAAASPAKTRKVRPVCIVCLSKTISATDHDGCAASTHNAASTGVYTVITETIWCVFCFGLQGSAAAAAAGSSGRLRRGRSAASQSQPAQILYIQMEFCPRTLSQVRLHALH